MGGLSDASRAAGFLADKYRAVDLKGFCKALWLPVSGTKAQMAERIAAKASELSKVLRAKRAVTPVDEHGIPITPVIPSAPVITSATLVTPFFDDVPDVDEVIHEICRPPTSSTSTTTLVQSHSTASSTCASLPTNFVTLPGDEEELMSLLAAPASGDDRLPDGLAQLPGGDRPVTQPVNPPAGMVTGEDTPDWGVRGAELGAEDSTGAPRPGGDIFEPTDAEASVRPYVTPVLATLVDPYKEL
ncbi:unnamed protein product [Symbiodinium microadriaticum]|nr:unnamed protein product [Symbiodinium microadriaticum]